MDLEKFSVSKATGFLPERPPLARLPGYYEPWETILDNLSALNNEKKIRDVVLSLPLLDVNSDLLPSEEAWERAHLVLSFLGQSYLWVEGEQGVPPCVPKCIAVPWCIVSDHLDVLPTLNYASSVLHNWHLLEPSKRIEQDNIGTNITFTGSRSEEWFYLISLFSELEAGPVIAQMPEAYKAIDTKDNKTIYEVLKSTVSCFAKLTQLLKRMDEHVSPEFFFYHLAVYFNGTDEQNVYPDGFVYEGTVPEVRKVPPTNAAQSSTIPAFDIFLDVQHTGTTRKSFRNDRAQMPKYHRNFLEELEKQPSMREYITTCGDPQLSATYNEALKGLSEFRSQHIVLVTRYVVIPYRNLMNGEAGNKSNDSEESVPLPFMTHLQSSRNETSQSEV